MPQGADLDLAVGLTTFNSMRTLPRVLESVRGLAAKIVAIDSGSTDGTIQCCRGYGAHVMHRDWGGHVPQKRFSVENCAPHEWVLILDSDESLEPDLQASIRRVVIANDPACDAWQINRKVWFLDGWLNHCFQPEWRLRLFRRGRERILGAGPDQTLGHDRIEVAGQIGRLPGVCRHDSWADVLDMCRRNVNYARDAASFATGGGGVLDVLARPAFTMFKQLVLRRGLLDGHRGVIAAAGAASGTLMKHLLIAERRAHGWRPSSGVQC
jgi:glycosyltransferase involved in cell wall biosynthesis